MNAYAPRQLTLADLISTVYEEFLALYGDKDIASVATAATVNELLLSRAETASVEAAA